MTYSATTDDFHLSDTDGADIPEDAAQIMGAHPTMQYAPSTGGFYMFELHGAGMPADAAPITDARHAELMAGQAAGQIIAAGADGAPVLVDAPPPPPPTTDAVRAECARRMAAIVAQYSPEERETWPIQVAEAQAVLAGGAEALMLAPLAAARGLPLAVFAGAVVQTANATKAATAKLLAAQARMLALPEIPSDFADDKWWE